MAIFLSLGSNVGNREANLQAAISLLHNELNIEINSISAVYETEPVGNIKQNWFYNIACSINSDIAPQNLLMLCKSIEYALGRRQAERWTERIIDIDILFYNDIILQTPVLTIPHNYLQYRKFVLKPMADIAPNYIHPVLNTSIRDLLQKCADSSVVKIAAPNNEYC